MSLTAFFNPNSVAVIGASANPQKLGYSVLENLIEGGYAKQGKIYPINLTSQEILGVPAFPTVQDVPGPIDLAATTGLGYFSAALKLKDSYGLTGT